MQIVVLGGNGLQGKAAVMDLANSEDVERVISADAVVEGWDKFSGLKGFEKIRHVQIDASSTEQIHRILSKDVDAAIDLLPLPFMMNAFEAAVEAGVPLVSTNYSEPVSPLHQRAKTAGIALIPECGLDPGIDLVLCGHAVSQFDEVHLFNSFCGGFPEKEACNNPINYKISWNWDLVLGSQMRDSVIIRDGNRIEIDGANQHDHEFLGTIDFPGLGMLESIPNGKVDAFTDLLGISDTVRSAGRYLLRWPGWSDFWRPLKALGFLSDKPLKNLSEQISPRQVVSKVMEPALHYAEGEKDIVAMYNEFQGVKEGRKKKIISKLLIKRDLESGFFAMNMGVGCPASIVAQMIAGGVITKKGVLSPAIDIPYAPFMLELANRGILIDEKITRDMA